MDMEMHRTDTGFQQSQLMSMTRLCSHSHILPYTITLLTPEGVACSQMYTHPFSSTLSRLDFCASPTPNYVAMCLGVEIWMVAAGEVMGRLSEIGTVLGNPVAWYGMQTIPIPPPSRS
mmetsp:Transcript_25656/g.46316  ORF Transcript_25656/g.46316 Transcript_25656/m.46316 type:complete len:118 (+) Transcript_25656:913-1266(+)